MSNDAALSNAGLETRVFGRPVLLLIGLALFYFYAVVILPAIVRGTANSILGTRQHLWSSNALSLLFWTIATAAVLAIPAMLAWNGRGWARWFISFPIAASGLQIAWEALRSVVSTSGPESYTGFFLLACITWMPLLAFGAPFLLLLGLLHGPTTSRWYREMAAQRRCVRQGEPAGCMVHPRGSRAGAWPHWTVLATVLFFGSLMAVFIGLVGADLYERTFRPEIHAYERPMPGGDSVLVRNTLFLLGCLIYTTILAAVWMGRTLSEWLLPLPALIYIVQLFSTRLGQVTAVPLVELSPLQVLFWPVWVAISLLPAAVFLLPVLLLRMQRASRGEDRKEPANA